MLQGWLIKLATTKKRSRSLTDFGSDRISLLVVSNLRMALSALALVCLASAAQAEIATYYGWDVEPRQVKGSILQA
jgi:hypothetical protein